MNCERYWRQMCCSFVGEFPLDSKQFSPGLWENPRRMIAEKRFTILLIMLYHNSDKLITETHISIECRSDTRAGCGRGVGE